MENNEEEKKWHLYVLRYNYSGNYYVGDTETLEKRMLVHLRRTSKLPKASSDNYSTLGFKYYWFTIDIDKVSRSEADLSENAFTREIDKVTEKFKGNIRGGDWAKNPYLEINPVEKEAIEDDEDHKKMHMYLKNIKEHKLETKKGKCSIISLREIGTVGEFKKEDYQKKWCEMRSVEFSVSKKGESGV